MKLLEIFLLAVAAILFCFAAYIFWLNRDDTALRAKIFSALLLGVAAAAAAGVFSLKAEKQEVSFSSIFVFNTKTRMPLDSYRDNRVNPLASCPNAPLIGGMLAQLDTMRNSTADHRNRKSEHTSYYDIVTALIVGDLVLLYSEGWDIELTTIHSGLLGRGVKRHAKPSPGATTVTRQDFSPLFDETGLLETVPLAAWGGKVKLPPATKMELNRDSTGRTITLTNPYATVRITIAPGLPLRGLGILSKWVTIPEGEQEDYTSQQFQIKVTAEYAYLRSGHPDMPVYRNWVKTMTEYLRSDLGSAAWEERLKPDPRDYMPEGT